MNAAKTLLEKDAKSVENATIDGGEFVIVLKGDVLDYFATLKGVQETGGVLYGFKISGREEYVISGWTTPQSEDVFSPCSFFRKDKRHFDLIKKLWSKDGTTMYFGDWHFHPVNKVVPSQQDYSSFAKVCKESKTSSKYIVNIIVAKQELVVFVYDKKRKSKLSEYHIY